MVPNAWIRWWTKILTQWVQGSARDWAPRRSPYCCLHWEGVQAAGPLPTKPLGKGALSSARGMTLVPRGQGSDSGPSLLMT